MALPTTAAQIEMMVEAMRRPGCLTKLFITPLFDLMVRKSGIYRQRPHTDDMRQMLDDIGIEWPEFQPISYDGLTFRLKPTAAILFDGDRFTPVSYEELYITRNEIHERAKQPTRSRRTASRPARTPSSALDI